MFAVLAGTIATAVVLLPILFVGDYPQKIFRPLATTLLIAVIVSYFISITFIPLIAPYLLKKKGTKNKIEEMLYKFSERLLIPLKNIYIDIIAFIFQNKKLSLPLFLFAVMMFIISLRIIIPTVGREIMPPMDTGIVKGSITADSNLSIEEMEKIVQSISKILTQDKRVIMYSIAVGSEPRYFYNGRGREPSNY